MYGMPLKSLASFAGAEMAAQIELMIQGMNQALGNKIALFCDILLSRGILFFEYGYV